MKKRLYILVDGEDDIRFFGRVIKPLFVSRYDSVEIVHYASIGRDKLDNFLKSLRQMGSDYIIFSDIDMEKTVRDKKQVLYYRFSQLEGHRIVVVIMEIESWYLAGVPESAAGALGMPPLSSTDNITKEEFNRLIPRRFDSRIDFMFEVLKYFSIAATVQKNRSFRFFAERYRLTEPA